MDLKQLEYFVRVAELGSFSRAALVVRLPQPSLSRHVRRLETDLRETLFHRNGRGVQLTEAGKRMFEHASAILELVTRARDEVKAHRGRAVGRVTVGMPPSIGRQLTPRLIELFKRDCPDGRLAVVEGLSTHLAEWLAGGRIDLALLHNPEPHESIEVRPVIEEALCLVGPSLQRRRPGVAPPPLPLRELTDYALILPDRSHAIRRLLEEKAALAGLHLHVAWEVSSIPSIVDLIAAGHGHGVLTASAVAISAHAKALTARRLVEPHITSTLCLGTSTTKRRTALARQVAAMLTELTSALPRE